MSASPLSINFHSPRNPSYLSVYNGLRIICSSPGNFTSQGLDLMSNLDLGEMMGLPPLYSSNVYVQCIRPMYTSNAHVQFRILQLANWIAYRVVRVRVNSRILSSSPDVFPDFKVLYFCSQDFWFDHIWSFVFGLLKLSISWNYSAAAAFAVNCQSSFSIVISVQSH